MQTVRSGPAVAASADGRSLMVAGGFDSHNALSSCDIFDLRMEVHTCCCLSFGTAIAGRSLG